MSEEMKLLMALCEKCNGHGFIQVTGGLITTNVFCYFCDGTGHKKEVANESTTS